MSNYFDNSTGIDKWFQIRRGKFTSSENYKLLVNGGKEVFSTGAKTYIETKVIEVTTAMWERPELEEVDSLLHGKVYEYPAYETYVRETKNYSMEYQGTDNPIFIECQKIKDESGGTPDIIHYSAPNTIDYGCEIKCPKNPAYHFRRLLWKDQFDLKEQYPSCYAQIQDLIRLTGAFGWDFISYDERQLSKSKKMKIIEVKPDQKFIDNLEIRIQLAVKEKYKLLSKYMGQEIKNRKGFEKFLKDN